MTAIVLELVSGPNVGGRVEARPGEMLEVGREARHGLAISADAHMSARHFALVCIDDVCRVRDLNSTNGTFVNGSRISEATLYDGDRIEAGRTAFVIRLIGQSASPRPTTSRPGEATVAPSSRNGRPENSPIPIFEIANATAFAVTTLRWPDVDSKPKLTIIVKATFVLGRE